MQVDGHRRHTLIANAAGELIAADSKTDDYFQADEDWWQAAWNGGKGKLYVSSITTTKGGRVASPPARFVQWRATLTADGAGRSPALESVDVAYLPKNVEPRIDEISAFLATWHGGDPAQFAPHLYRKTDREVVTHLFTVASSLDSMVLGETQILGQVRDAYDAAAKPGACGKTAWR